ncbi:glycosyltransferase family 2 protein [Empedobacter brevis]|uniref:glycosyltransferase family 2 protein n=1 Tax=Empedobacter brevis TaxID=247 RepID=UPI0039B0EF64
MNTNNSLISVIVPCYNQAQYMDECLQSVLDQTYQNWECIIVNDGSPDNTEDIALKWTNKDKRFIYLKKENGGLSSARNAGIEISKGEWILPLDSDDKIGNKYLELAAEQFGENYTIIYCQAEFFGDKKGKWQLPEYQYDKILIDNLIFCSAFYKKSSWKKVNGYDINMVYGFEDWEFWLSIIEEDSNVYRINEVLFYYRKKNVSMVTELYLDINKKKYSDSYIYKKHLPKYLISNDNPIENYKKNIENLNALNQQNYILNKNILTRLLFKVIKIF